MPNNRGAGYSMQLNDRRRRASMVYVTVDNDLRKIPKLTRREMRDLFLMGCWRYRKDSHQED